MSEQPTYALLRVQKEPEDNSWTITDDLRPGFVVADDELAKALAEVPTVIEMWDEVDAIERNDAIPMSEKG